MILITRLILCRTQMIILLSHMAILQRILKSTAADRMKQKCHFYSHTQTTFTRQNVILFRLGNDFFASACIFALAFFYLCFIFGMVSVFLYFQRKKCGDIFYIHRKINNVVDAMFVCVHNVEL